MSKRLWLVAPVLAVGLAGCQHTPKGVFAGRNGPNEFAVGRAAPLVIPPDFALVPPRPGEPRPQEADSSTQALNVLFGGRQPTSPGENALLNSAGPAPTPGIRSEAGSPSTEVVDKGQTTRDILNAQPSASKEATATTPAAATPAPPAAGTQAPQQ